MSLSAYILITGQSGKIDTIAKSIAKLENIALNLETHRTFGRYDIVLAVTVDSSEKLTELLLKGIHNIDGVEKTETLICMKD